MPSPFYFFIPILCFFFFLRQSFTLPPRLECSGAILAHYNLCLLDPSNSCASVTREAGVIGMHHHAQVIFVLLIETRFCRVGQGGLELLASSPLPTSASQNAGITGVSYCTWSFFFYYLKKNYFRDKVLLVSNSWPQMIFLPQPPK